MADSLNFSKMKVAELRRLCRDHGLPITGAKAEVVARLQANAASIGEDITEDDSLLAGEEHDDLKAIEKELDKTDDSTLDTSIDISLTENSAEPAKKKVRISDEIEPISPDKEHAHISLSKPLSETQKLELRAKKFGVVSEEAKKQLRAKKFGEETTSSTKVKSLSKEGASLKLEDLDRLKKRAERFGDSVSPSMKKLGEKEKQLKRQERFGVTTTSENNFEKKQIKLGDDTKKIDRAKRFGDVNTTVTSATDDVKRKRAERFGNVTAASNTASLDERKKKRLERFQ